jgi:calcineurin-like phosphoesterase family protein
MKTYITSDLHFHHRNIMKFCPVTRQYNDVAHMNSSMMNEWNSTVMPGDLVYILGDVAFCNADEAAKILKSLNGRKILVEGNHDSKLVKDAAFRDCFDEIHKYLEINYDGHKICMFHYPIAEFNQQHRGAIHFHGHLHGNRSGLEHYRVRDVAFDATGRVVSTMEQMIADALKGELKKHGDSEYAG